MKWEFLIKCRPRGSPDVSIMVEAQVEVILTVVRDQHRDLSKNYDTGLLTRGKWAIGLVARD